MTNTPDFGIVKLREANNHGYPVRVVGLPNTMMETLGWKKGEYLQVKLDKKTRTLKVSKLEVCGK